MEIKRNDWVYVFWGIVFSLAGAAVIATQSVQVGLYGLAALIAIGLVAGIYIKPHLGVIVLVISVFSNISNIFTENGLPSINKPLAVVVATAVFLRYGNSVGFPKGRRRTEGIEIFLALFGMAIALSYFAADNKERAIEEILDMAKDLIIIYSFIFALRHPDTWRQAAWAGILITAFLCLLGAYQVITNNYDQTFYGLANVTADVGEDSTTHRISGPIADPNIWGQVVVAVIPLVIYRVIYEKTALKKILSLLILGVLLYEILNTYSRGAYIALGILFILIMIEQRVRPVYWFSAAAVAMVVFSLLPASYVGRFQTLTLLSPSTENGIYQEGSFRGRSSKMLTGLVMFTDNPVLGVGAGNYPNNYQKYTVEVGLERSTEEQEAHSLYIEILSETGIVGIISFLGFCAFLLIGLYRIRRTITPLLKFQNWVPWISAMQLSIIGYLITSAFLHGGFIRYFWVFVALALSAIQLTEEMIIKPDHSQSLEAI